MRLSDCEPKTANVEDIVIWGTTPIKRLARLIRDIQDSEDITNPDEVIDTLLYAIEEQAREIEAFVYSIPREPKPEGA